ncbi:hypothetical protein BSK62_17265 [Paenibacillus odorifer]|uniref:hypothetical protein n=1 Tax=Paenibacillus TaxID=44249 RepID=UPI00096C4F69|nr:hypothetical protein [Paenibacillus odorifer]OMD64714.1 hypothetical protein BSK62_17265 [Paenibacillus odorifer]
MPKKEEEKQWISLMDLSIRYGQGISLKHPATSTELHLRMPPRVIRKVNNNMCNKQAVNSQPLFEHL